MKVRSYYALALAGTDAVFGQNAMGIEESGINPSLPQGIQDRVLSVVDQIIAIQNSDNDNNGDQPNGERTITLHSGNTGRQTFPEDVFQISQDLFVEQEMSIDGTFSVRRWTDESRPWTKQYSQFRRSIKVMLNETINADPKFTHGANSNMGYNEIDNNGRQTNFPKAVNTIPKMLRNYGCWCMPRGDRDWANGHGAAVDAVDEVCKGFGHCNACTELEKNCYEITDEAYAHTLEWLEDGEYSRKVLKCKDNVSKETLENEGKVDCLKMSCECQAHYIDKIVLMAMKVLKQDVANWSYGMDILDTHTVINPAFSQKGKYEGTFDFETCKKGKLRANQDMITHTPEHCCGSLPTWRVYDSQSGTRGCCGKKIFEYARESCDCETGFSGEVSCSVNAVDYDLM